MFDEQSAFLDPPEYRPIIKPPETWIWLPMEPNAHDWVDEFAFRHLGDRLEEITTKDLQDEDELDVFAAAILAVNCIATLERREDEGLLMVHVTYEGEEYVYFERDHGDIAGIVRRREEVK